MHEVVFFLSVVRTTGRCLKISELMEEDSSLQIIAGRSVYAQDRMGRLAGGYTSFM